MMPLLFHQLLLLTTLQLHLRSAIFAEKTTNLTTFTNVIQHPASQQLNTNWHTHYLLSAEDRTHLLGLPKTEQKVAAMMLCLRFPYQEKIDLAPNHHTTKSSRLTRSSQQINNKPELSDSAPE